MPSFITFHRVSALYFWIFFGDGWMFIVCELGNILAIFRSLGFYSWPLAFKSAPVLLAPSFDKELKLAVDASNVGAGSVLLQEDGIGVDHPVSNYSKKFNKHQRNYSTLEKECLSLILALQHFEVYLALRCIHCHIHGSQSTDFNS